MPADFRCLRVSVCVAAFSLLLSCSMFAQDASVGAAWRPNLDDFRARGRAAVLEWIAARRDTDVTVRAAESKEFDACIELASTVSNEGGGDLVVSVLAEAELRLQPAQDRTQAPTDQARMAANVGACYLRLAGDAIAARRLFRLALRIDPNDEVALEGLAQLARDEEIDLQKEIETVRILEIQAALDQQPHSVPSPRPPGEAARAAATQR